MYGSVRSTAAVYVGKITARARPTSDSRASFALADAAMPGRSTQSTTILVVEDQDAVRQMIVRSLVEQGYRVVEAGDGVQALVLLTSDLRIDMVSRILACPTWEASSSLNASP
jgi:PleD family two-component response regulator